MAPSIDIVLAAFNGERFITEQIESIIAQSCQDWRLTIRDDASADRTPDICRAYAKRLPQQIACVDDALGNLGCIGNFGRLLEGATAPYLMFCDQDDVWLPHKVAMQFERIRELEGKFGSDCPIASYTNARLVAEDLSPVAGSLLDYINRRHPAQNELPRLCMAGPCYGCTLIFNRALLNFFRGFPEGALSHDWWIGMIASAFGVLDFLDETPLLHRRHASNLSVTKKSSLNRYIRGFQSVSRQRFYLFRVFRQSAAFYNEYRPRMSFKQQAFFQAACRIPESNWLSRRWLVLRHGFLKTGFVKNCGLFLSL